MTLRQRMGLATAALLLGGLLVVPTTGEAGCRRARRHRCCAPVYYNSCNSGYQTAAYAAPVTQCCGTTGYSGQQTTNYGTYDQSSTINAAPSTAAPPPPAEAAPVPASK